jgi:hypothetical protein
VRRVAARAEVLGGESFRFQYVLEADPRLVRIPPPIAEAGRTDRLWAHTCFEAFIGVADSPQYLELNFSPSGQWAAYRFHSYREGMTPALDVVMRLAVRSANERLELRAEVQLCERPLGERQLGGRPAAPGAAPEASVPLRLRIALSTVVEDREGRLSYWALRHPPGRPDFHHPESFSLALELPATP